MKTELLFLLQTRSFIWHKEMFGKAANVKGKIENLRWIHRGPLVDKKQQQRRQLFMNTPVTTLS